MTVYFVTIAFSYCCRPGYPWRSKKSIDDGLFSANKCMTRDTWRFTASSSWVNGDAFLLDCDKSKPSCIGLFFVVWDDMHLRSWRRSGVTSKSGASHDHSHACIMLHAWLWLWDLHIPNCQLRKVIRIFIYYQALCMWMDSSAYMNSLMIQLWWSKCMHASY